jgi:hypothetical protein
MTEQTKDILVGRGFIVGTVFLLIVINILGENGYLLPMVMVGLVLALGGMGVYYWRRGDYKQARHAIGMFVFLVGVGAAGVAVKEHAEREKTAQSLTESEMHVRTEIEPSAKVMWQDAYQAAKEKYDTQTIILYGAGGFAVCCLLFVINLLANVVANGRAG